MLCTNYNVGLKTGREAETTPAKKEITIDEHTARHTFHQNFIPKRAESTLTQL
jgi:hypothetical protein